jgi:hypothetical protein
MSMNAYLSAVDAETLEKLRRNGDAIARHLEAQEGVNELRLFKMWQALHFMLTGTDWDTEGELGQCILGGEDVGPDIGYGPARVLAPAQVEAISNALSKISVESFQARFAPEQMEAMDIYPSVIWVREKDAILVELTELFERLVEVYRMAAARRDGMILWMT